MEVKFIQVTTEQFKEELKEYLATALLSLKEDLNLNFWEELLDVQGVANDIGVHKSTVYKWKGQEEYAMLFTGMPERITRREAREWFMKYSSVYSK